MQDENETEKAGVAQKSRRRSFDALKIRRALAEELAETGMSLPAFLVLAPAEKVDRLGARMMKGWRYREHEIPSAKAIASFFKAPPGRAEKAES